MELAVINPGFVVGAPLTNNYCSSAEVGSFTTCAAELVLYERAVGGVMACRNITIGLHSSFFSNTARLRVVYFNRYRLSIVDLHLWWLSHDSTEGNYFFHTAGC